MPLAHAFAKAKYSVLGFDVSEPRINELKSDKDRTNELTEKELRSVIIEYSTDPEVIAKADVVILAIPTPVDEQNKPDLTLLLNATKTVARHFKDGAIIVYESTVYPGVTEDLCGPILAKESGGKPFKLGYSPERINPGDEKWNIYNIDRNIGSVNKKFNKKIAHFYRSYIKANINEVSSLEVAEASKIIENTFRDINIAYVNELAKSFDKLGIDLHETISAASSKPFSFMPHWPGCGVGGHCIGVVPYYLIDKAQKNGFDHKFLKLARKINNSMPQYTVSRLIYGLKEVGLTLSKSKIALLGLSYKKDLADLRESPALEVKKELLKHGAIVKAYDPFVKTDTESLENALKDSVGVILATAHTEFVEKLPKLLSKTKIKVIVDGRNCLNKKIINKYKIIYKGIGR